MDAKRRAKIHFAGLRIVPAASSVVENSIRAWETDNAREQIVKPVWISLNKSPHDRLSLFYDLPVLFIHLRAPGQVTAFQFASFVKSKCFLSSYAKWIENSGIYRLL